MHPGALDLDVGEQVPADEVCHRLFGFRQCLVSFRRFAGKARDEIEVDALALEVDMRRALGWVSDKEAGYRYEPRHPQTGNPWPAMPQRLVELWNELAQYDKPPDACLVNVYDEAARMGLHQDKDKSDFAAPILSLSLGADCRFKLGGTRRGERAKAFALSSGDALVLSGPARMRYHGVDRILPTINTPLPEALAALGVRVNLTLRRVT